MQASPLPWWIVGTGSLLLLVAAVVLARLKWIQSQPIRACIVLSVFAHILLLAACYLTHLFDLPYVGGADRTITLRVSLQDVTVESEVETEPDRQTTEAAPPDETAALDAPPTTTVPKPIPAVDELPPDARDEAATEESTEPPEPEPQDEPPAVFPTAPDQAPVDQAPVEQPLATADTPPPSVLPPISPSPNDADQTTPWEHADRVPPPPLKTVDLGRERNSLAGKYSNRNVKSRLTAAKKRGGNPLTEAAVESSLKWLAKQQSPNGHWDASAHGAGRGSWIDGQERGSTGIQADTGITGLATLSFLGAGYTHVDGKYQAAVQRALDYLLSQQGPRGSLDGDAQLFAAMYCHGIATLAIVEAYAMTNDVRLRDAAQHAVNFSVASQNRVTGGWRYRPGDEGDTSQFGWQVMALTSAQEAGFTVSGECFHRMRLFLNHVSGGPRGGLASYRYGMPSTPAMTAEALVCRLFLGTATHEARAEAVQFISAEPPGAARPNFYYWYYGTLGLCQVGGSEWMDWNRSLQRSLLSTQRRFGAQAGSWDPATVWGPVGGRVYSTSMATLCLQAYYRYRLRETVDMAWRSTRP